MDQIDFRQLTPDQQRECDAIMAGELTAPGDGNILCFDGVSFRWEPLPENARICKCDGEEFLGYRHSDGRYRLYPATKVS